MLMGRQNLCWWQAQYSGCHAESLTTTMKSEGRRRTECQAVVNTGQPLAPIFAFILSFIFCLSYYVHPYLILYLSWYGHFTYGTLPTFPSLSMCTALCTAFTVPYSFVSPTYSRFITLSSHSLVLLHSASASFFFCFLIFTVLPYAALHGLRLFLLLLPIAYC
jgi:hypothetical protein